MVICRSLYCVNLLVYSNDNSGQPPGMPVLMLALG